MRFFFLCGIINERQYVKCMDMINQRGIIENTLSYNVTQWMCNPSARVYYFACMELNSQLLWRSLGFHF